MKLYTAGKVMSLIQIIFSHHFNNMPIVGYLSYTE